MKTIIIKPLTSELNADYLDFFDNRAFTDDNPNGPCYCTSPNQDEENIKQMVGEFKLFGVKDTVRKYAVEMLNVIKNNDSKRGMEIAENLCKEHNVSRNEAINMARNCFRI